MPLSVGTRFGPYEILSPLGAGGMGEVYRARDTRLDRNVAIKILSYAFVADAERVARFQREAKVLASLNHPHIAAIYGLEDAEHVTALVMELVEGEDLAERLTRGPVPLDEALPIASQLAEALETAHERGIIHRDLKPANVKLRPDGTVKVLDFGLAKAVSGDTEKPDLVVSPTVTAVATRAGTILGTAPYMSPEQAKGRPVDRRTDLWAFGVVLYELLTGTRAFQGESVAETLTHVLTRRRTGTCCRPRRPRRFGHSCGAAWRRTLRDASTQLSPCDSRSMTRSSLLRAGWRSSALRSDAPGALGKRLPRWPPQVLSLRSACGP